MRGRPLISCSGHNDQTERVSSQRNVRRPNIIVAKVQINDQIQRALANVSSELTVKPSASSPPCLKM